MNFLIAIIVIMIPFIGFWVSDEIKKRKVKKDLDYHIKVLEKLKSDKYNTYHEDEYRNVQRLDQWKWKKRINK